MPQEGTFRDSIVKNLEKLQQTANKEALRQMQFDFGEKYKLRFPDSIIVDFEKDMEISIFVDENNNMFRFEMKIILTPEQDQMELDGIKKFISLVDQYPELFKFAIAEALRQSIEQYNIKIQNSLKVDEKEVANIISALYSEFNNLRNEYEMADVDPDMEEELESAEYGVNWIEENWENMNPVEKAVAYERYLLPLSKGELDFGRVMGAAGTLPRHWNSRVSFKYESLGIDHAPAGPSWLNEIRKVSYETTEEQIFKIENMLTEAREPIDLRIYRVEIGCVIDFRFSGRDAQIENQIRGIPNVTTVRHLVGNQRNLSPNSVFRVYEIKFELSGRSPRNMYRDRILVPKINSSVKGVSARIVTGKHYLG